MEIKLTLRGAKVLSNKIDRFAAELQRTRESVLAQEARAVCVSLGFHTLPYGFDPPHPKFIGRITSEIRRVYLTKENIYAIAELIKPRSRNLALAFYRASKAGDTTKANRYCRDAGIAVEMLDPSLHRGARTGPRGSVAKNYRPTTVTKAASRDKFTREKIATIGTAKAGWYAAAKALGGRVRSNETDAATGKRKTEEIFPGYIRKLANKFGGLGDARVTPDRIEVFTNVTHGDEALSNGSLQTAIDTGKASFHAALQKSLSILRQKHFGSKAA